jgi:hypothetical protein
MKALTFSRVAAAFFLVAALLHVYRLVQPFPIQIGTFAVPHEASWAGVLVAGAMALWGFRSRG